MSMRVLVGEAVALLGQIKQPPPYEGCGGDCRTPTQVVIVGLVLAAVVAVMLVAWSRAEDDDPPDRPAD